MHGEAPHAPFVEMFGIMETLFASCRVPMSFIGTALLRGLNNRRRAPCVAVALRDLGKFALSASRARVCIGSVLFARALPEMDAVTFVSLLVLSICDCVCEHELCEVCLL